MEIDPRIREIRDSDLPIDEKKAKIREVLSNMSLIESRIAKDKLRILRNATQPRVDSKETEKQKKSGDVAIVEFDNLAQDFSIHMALITTINYTLEFLDQWEAPKKQKRAVRKFLGDALGYNNSKHIGSFQELFNKKQRELHPGQIPELQPPFDEFEISPDKVKNLSQYYNDRFEVNRIHTRGVFGSTPYSECQLYIHGIFSEADADKYRIANGRNFRWHTTAMPIGQEVLMQSFDGNKENTTIFNPDDPDVEIMLDHKRLIDLAANKELADRVEQGKSQVGKDSMKKINDYENTLKMTSSEEYRNLDIEQQKEWDANLRALSEKAMEGLEEIGVKDDETLMKINHPDGPLYIPIKNETIENFK